MEIHIDAVPWCHWWLELWAGLPFLCFPHLFYVACRSRQIPQECHSTAFCENANLPLNMFGRVHHAPLFSTKLMPNVKTITGFMRWWESWKSHGTWMTDFKVWRSHPWKYVKNVKKSLKNGNIPQTMAFWSNAERNICFNILMYTWRTILVCKVGY